ncbi:MSMEG_6728 family protein [Amycolatopsis magusensis]|uniref:MSMEG_6728 family protein n=1 Tax=Amycolatopsis magusensis TaxID=882444 RepID=UPI003C2EF3BF
MQTFLPLPGFTESARTLDRKRLGKQRVEVLQVLRALTVPDYGWRHHPAAAMWAGYEEALVRYGLDVCSTWSVSGAADTCAVKLVAEVDVPEVRTQPELEAAGELPPWLGSPDFHRSHQSALVRKDPAHYRPWFPDVPDDLPYVWPASDRPRRQFTGTVPGADRG